MRGINIKKRSEVEFNEYRDTAMVNQDDADIIDHQTPRSLLEESEDMPGHDLRDSGAGHALSMLFRVLDDKLRSRTNPNRGFKELTRRIVALAIRCGGIDKTYEEAAQVLGTSRQSLHLIGSKVAERMGLPDHSHPGKSRAGFRGAISKHSKVKRPIV
jgi:hypothetical protein